MSIPDCSQSLELLAKAVAERDTLRAFCEKTQAQVDSLDTELAHLAKVKEVLRKLVETTASASIQQLNDLVTAGLQDIFYDQNIAFEAVYFVKQGKPKLDMQFVIDGEARSHDLVGGGVIGVTSALLRLVEVKLFNLAPILLLDEPLVHLSARYLPGAAKFIREVASKFGVNVVMVSHQKEMSDNADVVLEARMSPTGLKVIEV